MSHYETLGVPVDADPAEIRRAYLQLARAHHPDTHAAEGAAALARAERRMRELNDAWAVLGDAERRRRYDDERRDGIAGASRPVAAPPGPPRPGWRPRADDTAWMDDFDAWKHDTDDLVPPDESRSTARTTFTILPVALFVAAVALGCVSMVLQARPLLAAAFVGVLVSALLFVLLPIIEMTRRR